MTPNPPMRERILDAAERLVLDHGFAATTVDAVLASAGASKGAFFHHFPAKAELGRALVERYSARDAELLETFMARAEGENEDPAIQLVAFLQAFESAAEDVLAVQPSCLFVSFIYEADVADSATMDIVRGSILHWRERILVKLEAAARRRAPRAAVDLPSLADQVFTTFEGAFLLTRALGDPSRMRLQLAHLRHYLELLFDVPATPPDPLLR